MLDLDRIVKIGFSAEQGKALLREMERIDYAYGSSSDQVTPASLEDQILALSYALKVFGDADKCVNWLCKKWGRIGGEVPLALIKSRQGCIDLTNALVKIDYGFFA